GCDPHIATGQVHRAHAGIQARQLRQGQRGVKAWTALWKIDHPGGVGRETRTELRPAQQEAVAQPGRLVGSVSLIERESAKGENVVRTEALAQQEQGGSDEQTGSMTLDVHKNI